MSSTHCDSPSPEGGRDGSLPLAPRKLHRLAEVRRRKGLTRKELADGLKIEVDSLKRLEEGNTDPTLSALHQWQRVLGATLAELLVDSSHPLSLPTLGNRRVKDMLKMAMAILKQSRQPTVRRLACTLVDQLLEIAPHLESLVAAEGGTRKNRIDSQGRLLPGKLPGKLSANLFLKPPE